MKEHALLTTPGLCLGTRRWSETSRMVTLLSPDLGRFTGLARGAFRKGSPFAGVVEPFSLCEYVLYYRRSREVQSLSACSLIAFYPRIRGHADRLAVASAAIEVIGKTVREGHPVPGLFELIRAYLNRLEARPPADGRILERLLFVFLLRFLRIMGFAPELGRCVRCGAGASGVEVRVSFRSGGVLCGACGRGEPRAELFSAGALREAARLERGGGGCAEAAGECGPDPLRRLIRGFLETHFEKDMRLNSLELFRAETANEEVSYG